MNRNVQHRKWTRKNLDHVRSYKRKWAKKNRAKQTRYNHNWYQKHMAKPDVRSKHYKQNDKWRSSQRYNYHLSNLKSGAFGYVKYSRDTAKVKKLIDMISQRLSVKDIAPDSDRHDLSIRKPPVTALTMGQYYSDAKLFIRRTGEAQILETLCCELKAKLEMLRK